MNKPLILVTLILATFASSANADKPEGWNHKKYFPDVIDTPTGSPPEGFTIGKRFTAYNGSIDGSIYKFDLRTGDGEVLVPAEPNFDVFNDCYKLGMRVDPRTNYLFVAGCFHGTAYVYDADSGELIMEYQLDDSGGSVINDMVITRDAVYFTDFAQPFLYKLPLGRRGEIPSETDAATAIELIGEWANPGYAGANGIVATPDGAALIVGDSSSATLYNVDPDSGQATTISIAQPLFGFIDGIAMRGRTLYIVTPNDPSPISGIQVVKMERDMLSGSLVGVLTNPELDGVASGALLGNWLYVNNARYSEGDLQFDDEGNVIGVDLSNVPYWVTKVKIPWGY